MKKSEIDVYLLLDKVRTQKPVVHHLTNWVTIYDCAQIVKSFGASPVMAHAKEEADQMAAIASSLVLNIGTLTQDFVESMKVAARSANKKGIPVILDVCGAGATELRDKKTFELLESVKINIIKGNASEIARVAGEAVFTKGVDASDVRTDMLELAKRLAKIRTAIVVVTGAIDIITDGTKTYLVRNGHPLMAAVVGTGCMASSVIGTFAAVEDDLVGACVAGLVCFEIASERAAKSAKGPGSFKEKMFDNVYNLNKTQIHKLQKIQCV